MNPLISRAMGWIISQLFFLENSLGIKLPTKFDMQLNKETKPSIFKLKKKQKKKGHTLFAK